MIFLEIELFFIISVFDCELDKWPLQKVDNKNCWRKQKIYQVSHISFFYFNFLKWIWHEDMFTFLTGILFLNSWNLMWHISRKKPVCCEDGYFFRKCLFLKYSYSKTVKIYNYFDKFQIYQVPNSYRRRRHANEEQMSSSQFPLNYLSIVLYTMKPTIIGMGPAGFCNDDSVASGLKGQ